MRTPTNKKQPRSKYTYEDQGVEQRSCFFLDHHRDKANFEIAQTLAAFANRDGGVLVVDGGLDLQRDAIPAHRGGEARHFSRSPARRWRSEVSM